MLRDELDLLGVSKTGLTEGSTSRTFLVQPYPAAVVEGFAGEILDPALYIEKTRYWGRGDQPAPISKPSSDASDGLFVWG